MCAIGLLSCMVDVSLCMVGVIMYSRCIIMYGGCVILYGGCVFSSQFVTIELAYLFVGKIDTRHWLSVLGVDN